MKRDEHPSGQVDNRSGGPTIDRAVLVRHVREAMEDHALYPIGFPDHVHYEWSLTEIAEQGVDAALAAQLETTGSGRGGEAGSIEPEQCATCGGDGWLCDPDWREWHARNRAARNIWEAAHPDSPRFDWHTSAEAQELQDHQPDWAEEYECDDCNGTGQKPVGAMESMSLALRAALEGDQLTAATHYERARQAARPGNVDRAVAEDIAALLERTPRGHLPPTPAGDRRDPAVVGREADAPGVEPRAPDDPSTTREELRSAVGAAIAEYGVEDANGVDLIDVSVLDRVLTEGPAALERLRAEREQSAQTITDAARQADKDGGTEQAGAVDPGIETLEQSAGIVHANLLAAGRSGLNDRRPTDPSDPDPKAPAPEPAATTRPAPAVHDDPADVAVGADSPDPVGQAKRAVLELKGRRALEQQYAQHRQEEPTIRGVATTGTGRSTDGPVLSAFDD